MDETISREAVKYGQIPTVEETNDRLAQAIRSASTLPFCDVTLSDVVIVEDHVFDGIRTITFISKSKPASHVTPTAVQFG